MGQRSHFSSWQKMRKELKSFLAPSLTGRVDYLSTSYRQTHDYLGHAQILVDGVPVTDHCDYKVWMAEIREPADLDRVTNDFKQYDFVHAAGWYLSSPIEESLDAVETSEYRHTVVLRKCLALMDRRVGKRTLVRIASELTDESPAVVRYFCALRCGAEDIPIGFEVPGALIRRSS